MMSAMDTKATVNPNFAAAFDALYNDCEALKLVSNARFQSPPVSRLTLTLRIARGSTLSLLLAALTLILCVQLPDRSDASPLSDVHYENRDNLQFYAATVVKSHEMEDNVALAHETSNSRRLSKRHIKHQQQPAGSALEWHSSCGEFDAGANDHSPGIARFYLKTLRRSLRNEYETLTRSSNSIDANITEWRLHERNYKFLPRLKDNAPLMPMCWHRGMQKFIASFAFLSDLQGMQDSYDRRMETDTFKELRELLHSAKRVLCEVAAATSGVCTTDKHRLSFYSGEEMRQLLSFRTNDERTIMSIDLRFAKHHYYNYLQAMRRSIQHGLRANRLAYGCSASTSTISDIHFGMSENLVVRSSKETADSTC